jgi:ribosomal protein L37AE/L43A
MEDYIILFNGKEYYINNKYLFNKETYQIYSVYWSKYLKPFFSSTIGCGERYIAINSFQFNYKKLIEWNTDPTIDRTKLQLVGDVKKICRKCKRYDVKFPAKKITLCNDCIKTHPNTYQQKISTEENFMVADKFLHKLKAKKWMATDLDLFQLVDIYERYFPNMILGQPLNENYASKVLHRIVKHHNKLKSEAIKKYIRE